MLPILAWLWHRAAVLAAGYLVGGWRGLLAALVLREMAGLLIAGIRSWALAEPAPRRPPPPPSS